MAAIRLSTKGFENIPISAYEENFTFLVGDAKYPCPSFVADFMSPRISQLHSIDLTVTEFRINAEDSEAFSQLFSMMRGRAMTVDSSNRLSLLSICRQLLNAELFHAINSQLPEELTTENVLDRLKFLHAAQSDFQSEVSFISAHFDAFRDSDLCQLDFPVLQQILEARGLCGERQDSLFEFLAGQIEDTPQLFSLFECIQFKLLSFANIQKFVQLVSSSLELLSPVIWENITSFFMTGFERKIRVLHIRPPDNDATRMLLDLGRLCSFDPLHRIEFTAVNVPDYLKKPHDYLTGFDVVMLGGRDGPLPYGTSLTREIVAGRFVPYYEHGGCLLFMHDVFSGAQCDVWREFTSALGFNTAAPKVSPYLLNGELDLLRTDEPVLHHPFIIKRFTPVLSHATNARARHQGTVIGKRQGNQIVPYYTQGLGQGGNRLALLDVCHDHRATNLEDMEWRLIVNIIYNFPLKPVK
jgi:hypothetical protein